MKRVLVVYNISAGRKKALAYKKKLQKFLVKKSETFKFINIEELSQTFVDNYDTIIAMGGDGTINKIVPFIINTDKTLGIIPCGTANLLSARLGVSSNINKSIQQLNSGKTTTIDIIKVNDKYSVLRTGFGYDSNIICKTPQSLKNKFGYFSYFIAGIIFALRLKLKEYKIEYNNQIHTAKTSSIIIANSANMYKNSFLVGKNSKLNDGLFEVFILKTSNPILFFFEFLKIGLGIPINSKSATYFQTESLKIYKNITQAHIDGEKSCFQDEVEFNIISNKLHIIKP